MNDKTILFHCAVAITDEDGNIVVKENGKIAKEIPTHTLAFSKVDSKTLAMSWAVAREGVDNYNRKTGRAIAEGRLEALFTNIGESNEYVALEGVSTDYLPNRVVEDNFDFYLNKATALLFADGEDGGDGIELVFHSVDKEMCTTDVDFTAEEDDELVQAKANASDATADFIYGTYVNEDNEVIVHVQFAKDYDEKGYSDTVSQEMANVLGPIMNEVGFLIVDEHKPILVHEDMAEIEVVRFLQAKGIGYSEELDAEIIAD